MTLDQPAVFPSTIKAEYIWMDGRKPTAHLRSKMRILEPESHIRSVNDIPEWSFDGSSTEQAKGHESDRALKPVFFCPDPIRGKPNILVLCEVMMPDGSPHPSNTRAVLREVAQKHEGEKAIFAFEQEYTMYDRYGNEPLAWPMKWGVPEPQGKYYCGVGANEVVGRPLVEAHVDACLGAGIKLFGTNAEVMQSQWEFQINPLSPLEICDKLWLARWLIYRLGEDHGITIRLTPKPKVDGDWNGAGAHVNFSTVAMRDEDGSMEDDHGISMIKTACELLKFRHSEHIKVYGAYNGLRLTGKHETCSIHEFRYGELDRGASVRIGLGTVRAGKGYLEDRRPAANMDPYKVCTALLETVCGNGFEVPEGWEEPMYV